MNSLVTLVGTVTLISLLLASSLFVSIKAAATEASMNTKTPIKHIVILFQENVSFDHYFGTYPNATNPPGEPKFTAFPNTPSVNGLTHVLLTNNPNGNYSVNPFRIDRSQAFTCDMNHEYTAEQKAYNGGLLKILVLQTPVALTWHIKNW